VLTKDEIEMLLDRLAEVTVVAPSPAFPYRVCKRGFGYSDEKGVGALQAKLSMMLEAASKRSV